MSVSDSCERKRLRNVSAAEASASNEHDHVVQDNVTDGVRQDMGRTAQMLNDDGPTDSLIERAAHDMGCAVQTFYHGNLANQSIKLIALDRACTTPDDKHATKYKIVTVRLKPKNTVEVKVNTDRCDEAGMAMNTCDEAEQVNMCDDNSEQVIATDEDVVATATSQCVTELANQETSDETGADAMHIDQYCDEEQPRDSEDDAEER